jgi:hypothetical protein
MCYVINYYNKLIYPTYLAVTSKALSRCICVFYFLQSCKLLGLGGKLAALLAYQAHARAGPKRSILKKRMYHVFATLHL